MKKTTIIVMEKSQNDALEKLRGLGVVHVRNVIKPEGGRIDLLKDRLAKVGEARRILSRIKPAGPAGSCKSDGLSMADQVDRLMERRKRIEEELAGLRAEAERLSSLGDFDPKEIREQESRGLFIHLYTCRKDRLSELPRDTVHFVVGGMGKDAIIAMVSRKKEVHGSLKPFPLPMHSPMEMDAMVRRKESELDRVAKELSDLSRETKLLTETLSGIEDELEFEQAALGMGKDGPLSYIQGYCPTPEIHKLKNAVKESGWGLWTQDPSDKDSPPTLIKNPKWINIISPVFKILNTLPGYREFDISLGFLVYLGLFFAILIGDAGYGALFLATTMFTHFRFQNVPREPVYLMYFFSITTLIWGALIGNWFGVESLSDTPFLHGMIIPSLHAFSSESQDPMMMICFIIGASHLTIAHLILAFSVINSLKALAQIGWIMIIWGMFFLIRHLVLDFPIPLFLPALLLGGMGLIILFTAPQKNMMKGVGIGLANLPMGAINCFSDIISYIRLFAVGMATLAVAVSFNTMAAELGFGTPFHGLSATLILILGHALNLIMAALAIIVHGVRLNMLEFSGHLNMQWSGFEYKPFSNKE